MKYSLTVILGFVGIGVLANPMPWSVDSFSYENGFQLRTEGMLDRIAEKDVMDRSKASSICPDTGLPVLTWALEGETIISPYSGRAYIQGNTGYFGPKERNDLGQISKFGGDPLKHSLMYATAKMLLNPDDPELKAFLGIPGNLRQQYHFAAVNWGRFWPLFHDEMGSDWNQAFMEAISDYSESGRPSDGYRQYPPLRNPHTLVGDPDEHLGGGGTENHKTMWRSTALLYAQLFPNDALISGHPTKQAQEQVEGLFSDYASKLFTIGNGEYDSSIYCPYSIKAFLNLHDFSPNPETKAMAKSVMDYYLATYGLKMFNGTMTGAQRRGYPNSHAWNDMDLHLWAWVGGSNSPASADQKTTSLHQITSSYRPNRIITDLIHKDVDLPFEAWINHPFYDMSGPDYHLEYYYQDREFSLGSVQLHDINNSGQQTTWVLALRGESGDTVTITGGQPRWIQRGGFSPYDQYVQHKNTLIYMMDQTAPNEYGNIPETLESHSQTLGHISYDRYSGRAGPLVELDVPDGNSSDQWSTFLENGIRYAGTFLWIPRKDVDIDSVSGERIILRIGKTRVIIIPIAGKASLHAPDTESWNLDTLPNSTKMLANDQLLILPGTPGGFVMEVIDAGDFDSNANVRNRLNLDQLDKDRVGWQLADGNTLSLQYQAQKLRPRAFIDGKSMIPEAWQGRGHVDSPYLKIKDGRFNITDGKSGYEANYNDPQNPVFKQLK
ncbi:MAG: hypothetical protein AB3N63_17775 [Puniceicoccaceae bacterium]